MSSVKESCTIFPLSLVNILRACGSWMMLGDTIPGPNGALEKFLSQHYFVRRIDNVHGSIAHTKILVFS